MRGAHFAIARIYPDCQSSPELSHTSSEVVMPKKLPQPARGRLSCLLRNHEMMSVSSNKKHRGHVFIRCTNWSLLPTNSLLTHASESRARLPPQARSPAASAGPHSQFAPIGPQSCPACIVPSIQFGDLRSRPHSRANIMSGAPEVEPRPLLSPATKKKKK